MTNLNTKKKSSIFQNLHAMTININENLNKIRLEFGQSFFFILYFHEFLFCFHFFYYYSKKLLLLL